MAGDKNQDPLFFEMVLIKFFLVDHKICEQIYPYLTLEIFDDIECKKIIKWFIKFKERYDKFPVIKEMKIIGKKKNFIDKLNEIIELNISEYKKEFLLDEIEEFFKQKLIYSELSNGVDKLQEGEIDKITTISDKIKEYVAFSFNESIGLNLFSEEGKEEIKKHIYASDDYVETGLKDFDKNTSGGLHKCTISAFIAESGLGKTLTKCSVAANLISSGRKVLYVTLELSRGYLAARILQNVWNLKRNQLYGLKEEKFDELYDDSIKKLNNNLYIDKFAQGMFNSNKLDLLTKNLIEKKKFYPDVVIVDYLGIFAPNGNKEKMNSNEQGVHKCQELAAYSFKYQLPILTSAQSNRDGYGKGKINPKNIADSIGIMQETDIVVGITQTMEQEETEPKTVTFDFMKNRFGNKHNSFELGINTETMRLINLDDKIKDNSKIVRVTNNKKEEKKKKSLIDFS